MNCNNLKYEYLMRPYGNITNVRIPTTAIIPYVDQRDCPMPGRLPPPNIPLKKYYSFIESTNWIQRGMNEWGSFFNDILPAINSFVASVALQNYIGNRIQSFRPLTLSDLAEKSRQLWMEIRVQNASESDERQDQRFRLHMNIYIEAWAVSNGLNITEVRTGQFKIIIPPLIFGVWKAFRPPTMEPVDARQTLLRVSDGIF